MRVAGAMSKTQPPTHADKDAAEVFAAFAAALRFDDLPPPVVAQTKLTVVDTIGVALAGAVLG